MFGGEVEAAHLLAQDLGAFGVAKGELLVLGGGEDDDHLGEELLAEAGDFHGVGGGAGVALGLEVGVDLLLAAGDDGEDVLFDFVGQLAEDGVLSS